VSSAAGARQVLRAVRGGFARARRCAGAGGQPFRPALHDARFAIVVWALGSSATRKRVRESERDMDAGAQLGKFGRLGFENL
jgi:hypothetical protein